MRRYLIPILQSLTLALAMAFTVHNVGAATMNGIAEGSFIVLKTDYGTTFSAYAAGDQDAENGILLVHDKWGLDAYVIQWADRFAELGYRVLAVDLYDGRQVSDDEMADEVVTQIDPVWIEADLKGAVKYLKLKQRNVVIMGWGMGGENALSAALQIPDINALITYYAEPVVDDQKLATLNGPMLAIFAKRDIRVDTQEILALKDSMAALGKELWVMEADADRGFANPRTGAFNKTAIDKAWITTNDFLSKELGTPAVKTTASQ